MKKFIRAGMAFAGLAMLMMVIGSFAFGASSGATMDEVHTAIHNADVAGEPFTVVTKDATYVFDGVNYTKITKATPVPTDPVPTDPVPTDPVPTDPVPTDPVPTTPPPTTTPPSGVISAADYSKDSAGLQKAVDAAISAKKSLYVPAGTYVMDSAVTVRIRIPAGQSFTMYGDGNTTIFKRKDGTATKDGQNMFYVQPVGGTVPKIEFYSFRLDGNARGNPLPAGTTDLYLWEHSASIKIAGDANARITNAVVHDISATDGLADHIFFSGGANAYVDHGHIYNFNADNRNRKRSDVTVTGGMKTLLVENSTMPRLEAELNQPYDEGIMEFTARNVNITTKLDIAGDHETRDTLPPQMHFTGENITANDLNLHVVYGSIKNSTFNLDRSGYMRLNDNDPMVFENVTWNIRADSQGLPPLALQPYDGNDFTFIGGSFNVIGGGASYPGPFINAKKPASGMDVKYKFIGVTFDPRVAKPIQDDTGGKVTIQP